ncbi:MAG TPA: hypothetical protein VJ501_00660, partial [Burkholderiaceae bacterium]|nr:hypothetical protein [Burkholderiaceae bacterium]
MSELKHAERARLNRALRSVFGHDRMREAQEPVIANVLAGRNTLAILPTGAASACAADDIAACIDALAAAQSAVVLADLLGTRRDFVPLLLKPAP